MKQSVSVFLALWSFSLFLCVSSSDIFSAAVSKTPAAITPQKKKPQTAQLRRSIVGIEVYATHSAYSSIGRWVGTGFLCDLKNGLVLTNKHVAPPDAVATYTLLFFNGQKVAARFLYADPWHDFAFLKIIDPKQVPASACALEKFNAPCLGQSVLMMGNNQGQAFSFQKGVVTSVFQDVGLFPQPSMSVTMNSAGGSSGSPLIDEAGEVVGLNYAGNNAGLGYAIHADVLSRAKTHLAQGRRPKRFHTGAVLRLISLDHARRFYKLPEGVCEKLAQRFPESHRRVLQVVGRLKGSPAEAVLQTGDILVSVDAIPVGPAIGQVEKLFDAAQGKTVTLEVYRQGQRTTAVSSTYDLDQNTISKLLVFGGAILFEADETMRWQFGVLPGQMMIQHVLTGSAFSRGLVPSVSFFTDVSFQSSDRLCAISHWSFDTWRTKIPALIRQKDFVVPVWWLSGTHLGYSGIMMVNRRQDLCGIHYDVSSNIIPEVIEFSKQHNLWRTSPVQSSLRKGIKS